MAAIDDGLDAYAGDPDTAADGQEAQLEQVQADAAEGGVRDGGTAEGEREVDEVRAAKGDDFGGGVGKGAAERLEGNILLALIFSYLSRKNPHPQCWQHLQDPNASSPVPRLSETQSCCPSSTYSQLSTASSISETDTVPTPRSHGR